MMNHKYFYSFISINSGYHRPQNVDIYLMKNMEMSLGSPRIFNLNFSRTKKKRSMFGAIHT